MSRIIYADDVKKRGDCYPPEVRSIISNILRHIKTIKDVTPVKHGHWIEQDGFDGDTYYDCSVCGHSWVTIEGTPQDNEMNYCPYCGAHMDEVSE